MQSALTIAFPVIIAYISDSLPEGMLRGIRFFEISNSN
jgi:hypothetical protein